MFDTSISGRREGARQRRPGHFAEVRELTQQGQRNFFCLYNRLTPKRRARRKEERTLG